VLTLHNGIWGDVVCWGNALQTGRSRIRFPMVSLEFFIDITLPAALWHWGRPSLSQKWAPGILPRGNGGRCVWLTTVPLSSAGCLEILEPQPPVYLRDCPDLYRDCCTFTFTLTFYCTFNCILRLKTFFVSTCLKRNHSICVIPELWY
jgi:hypothetical protein